MWWRCRTRAACRTASCWRRTSASRARIPIITRCNYVVKFASDPENVSKANTIIVQELKQMQDTPVGADELQRTKALMLRQIPLGEASIARIARALAGRWELDLPLDEPTNAARRYIALGPAEVQAAFKKWVRPGDLVRVSQGPSPQ